MKMSQDKKKKNFRFWIAFIGAKAMIFLMRLLKRNASYLPGAFADKICSDLLSRIDKPENIVCVTGTNGKTTVCNMLISAHEKLGKKALDNHLGSNTKQGVVTAFINGAKLSGKTKYNYAVIEVDERSSHQIYPHLKPNYIILTNLFQDSYQRNAHPFYIRELLERTIPDVSTLIVNADDLLVSTLKEGQNRVGFSIAKQDYEKDINNSLSAVVRVCPNCRGKLTRDFIRYHHIGRYHCENCGFESLKAKYEVRKLDLQNKKMTVEIDGDAVEYGLPGDNITDAYNLLAVISYLNESKLVDDRNKKNLDYSKIEVVSSRFEKTTINGKNIYVALAKGKNPIATSRIMDYIGKQDGRHAVIFNNGTTAHFAKTTQDSMNNTLSENTAWLYEADFSALNNDKVIKMVVTGKRYLDFYNRLLFEGIEEDKIALERDPLSAYKHIDLNEVDDVYILFQVYNRAFAISNRDGLVERIKNES